MYNTIAFIPIKNNISIEMYYHVPYTYHIAVWCFFVIVTGSLDIYVCFKEHCDSTL